MATNKKSKKLKLTPTAKPKNKTIKVVLIVIGVIVLILTGFLVYSYIFGSPFSSVPVLSPRDIDSIDYQRGSCGKNGVSCVAPAKPVIMLYADKDTNFTITQNFTINDSFIYPSYNHGNGWSGKVLAGKEGDLVINNKNYDYLFWEGKTGADISVSKGNVVSKANTINFLENTLSKYGMTDREKLDFITYWGPKLSKNDYNLISFVNDEYATKHPMEVSPKPDYMQRIFMVYKAVDKNYKIDKQEFTQAPARHGFMLIEWGGDELK